MAVALTVMLGSLTACGFSGLLPSDPTSETETTTAPTQEPTEPDVTVLQPGDTQQTLDPTQPEATELDETTTTDPESNPVGEQTSQKQLFDEAVRVYSDYQKLEIAAEQGDGGRIAPEELSKYATGEFYNNVVSGARNANQMKYRLADDAAEKVKLELRPHEDPQNVDALVSLDVCVDMSEVEILDTGTNKPAAKGFLTYRKVAMKRVDGSLKIFMMTKDRVTECPFKGQ